MPLVGYYMFCYSVRHNTCVKFSLSAKKKKRKKEVFTNRLLTLARLENKACFLKKQ